ncbi:pilus assembly protein TadG-related protein [Paraburkholderia ferrariae]|uniref:pilus assembly protein TadG-related protein n=1 Tax=Paraburkholderia ferrariae TaxID=386056 RepID=UPI00048681BB|nr:pilus assembly protein TadG-related protein [Paraburkholderia ferrariae]
MKVHPERLRGRGRQRGQALPFALVFLVIGAAALYLAFNAAQLAHAKTKAQDTADSAAYSVGVLQARDLNFAAYTNRAMIANQVAVAQMVSIKSYVDELAGTYANTHWFDEFIESSAAISEPWVMPKESGGAVLNAAKSALDIATRLVTVALDGFDSVLSSEQAAFHDSIVLQIPIVAEEVAQANEPDSHVTKTYFATRGALALNSTFNFVKRNKPAGTTGEDRFADVVTDKTTLDQFVQQRGANIRDPFVASIIEWCPGASFIGADNNHLGGTQLRQDKRGWEGIDATDVNGGWICYFEVGAVGGPIIDAAGSGGAADGPGGSYSGANGYGGFNNFGGSLTSMLTRIAAREQYYQGPGSSLSSDNAGLQPYLELATLTTPANGANFNRAPAITVEVQRLSSSVSTTDQIKIASGQLQVTDGTANNQLRAVSSASAYFIRPADSSSGAAGGLINLANWRRSDNKWEYPSLFNPYWQSSLVDTNLAAVEAADLAQSAGAP